MIPLFREMRLNFVRNFSNTPDMILSMMLLLASVVIALIAILPDSRIFKLMALAYVYLP